MPPSRRPANGNGDGNATRCPQPVEGLNRSIDISRVRVSLAAVAGVGLQQIVGYIAQCGIASNQNTQTRKQKLAKLPPLLHFFLRSLSFQCFRRLQGRLFHWRAVKDMIAAARGGVRFYQCIAYTANADAMRVFAQM